MTIEQESPFARHWDNPHRQPRFRPRYPNEHVVRFLMTNFPKEPRDSLRALDVGFGGGVISSYYANLASRR